MNQFLHIINFYINWIIYHVFFIYDLFHSSLCLEKSSLVHVAKVHLFPFCTEFHYMIISQFIQSTVDGLFHCLQLRIIINNNFCQYICFLVCIYLFPLCMYLGVEFLGPRAYVYLVNFGR